MIDNPFISWYRITEHKISKISEFTFNKNVAATIDYYLESLSEMEPERTQH